MSHKTAATVAPTIAIDTGKNTLHLIGLDDKGAIVLREKVSRGRITARLANVQRYLIGIEAGMATHYVARELSALGHDVKQVPQGDQLAVMSFGQPGSPQSFFISREIFSPPRAPAFEIGNT